MYYKDGNNKLYKFSKGAQSEADWKARTEAKFGIILTKITKAELFTLANTPKTVDEAKVKKLAEIEADFVLAESQTVTVNSIVYEGGRNSAESIDGYVRLNRLAGNTTHNIWDHQGTESALSDIQADAVIIAIGSASSVNRFNKKNRKVALASLPPEATIADVEAI